MEEQLAALVIQEEQQKELTPEPGITSPALRAPRIKGESGEAKRRRLEEAGRREAGVCLHFLVRKGQWCKHAIIKGTTYCHFHQESEATADRQYCGRCKTLVLLKKWRKHVATACPYQQRTVHMEAQPWYEEDVSAGVAPTPEESEEVLSLRSLTRADFDALRGRIEAQQSAIIAQQRKMGLLDPRVVVLEMGAGKAELSRAIQGHCRCGVVAVDMQNFRLKSRAERHLDGEVTRLLCNIKDLALERVEALQDMPVVSVSKHLCGSGSDFCLRSLMRGLHPSPLPEDGSAQAPGGLSGILLAEHGFGAKEFPLLCSLSSWAVSGFGDRDHCDGDDGEDGPEAVTGATEEAGAEDTKETGEDKLGYFSYWISHEERALLGRQCKRLLDAGRVQYLRQNGYNATMVHYIEQARTPENVLILATPRPLQMSDRF